jgi:hypothetical protein
VKGEGEQESESKEILWLTVTARDLRADACAVNIIHVLRNILRSSGKLKNKIFGKKVNHKKNEISEFFPNLFFHRKKEFVQFL